jgi:rhodanese-related sulfurtransferase
MRRKTPRRPAHSFLSFYCLLVFGSCQGQNALPDGAVGVSAIEFQERLQAGRGLLIDVRTPAEFAEGHLPGARLVSIHDEDFSRQVAALDTSQTVFVYCRTDNRSRRALRVMSDSGFRRMVLLLGGINAWKKEGLPVEK